MDSSTNGSYPADSSPITFASLNLRQEILNNLKRIGYHVPSPIQAAFIPEALKGIDVIGQAQTGTGKTAAFLLPVLERINPDDRFPQVLILGPTRELVAQVYEEGKKLVGDLGFQMACIYGGEGFDRQIRELRAGAQIIVGTPGRIIDMIRRQHLQIKKLRVVILDEADRMLDIGFRPDIERILKQTPTDRQTLLLSATMPAEVLGLTNRYMMNPAMVDLSSKDLNVDRIDQRSFRVDEDRKLKLLMRLLVREKPRQCLIFCQMKSRVRWLADELGKRIRGVMAMQGDMPQNKRSRVMKAYREGEIRLLVATDVVGRGIDVEGISHVINFDIPDDPDAYVHRIGRTGRMGKDGLAFTFVTPNQSDLLTAIEKHMNKMIEADSIEGFIACYGRKTSSPPVGRGRPGGGSRRPGGPRKPGGAKRPRNAGKRPRASSSGSRGR
ncbi:DEAD/DEAH box helicase [bacterium]|nr:DEAD/DEAH box helicase [bacterium]